MPRPSRNIDAQLLQAGRELFPDTGVQGLTVRRVADRAHVNLGMFHYHFRNKQAFVRALLQQIYDEMFARLELAAAAPAPVEALRRSLNVLGRFARDNASLLRRLMAEMMAGEPFVLEFLRANMPRHVGVLAGLVRSAQRDGSLQPIAIPQAIALLAGSVAAPLVIGAALGERGLFPREVAATIAHTLTSDRAIAQRVDCALAGLSAKPGLKRGASR